jgi:hypothetical protein
LFSSLLKVLLKIFLCKETEWVQAFKGLTTLGSMSLLQKEQRRWAEHGAKDKR